jgi:glycerophosphoryl diester phosphodiesterase
VAAVRRHGFREAVIIGSFQPELIEAARREAPEIPTALLVRPAVADPVGEAVTAGGSYVHLCWEKRSANPAADVTPELLARCRAAGLGVVLWHEERPAVIECLRGLPVDAVCGNRPELLRVLRPA